MQVTFVGEFISATDSTEKPFAELSGQDSGFSHLANSRQVIASFDAGFVADLVVCGPEIDANELVAGIEAIGLPVPSILQPVQQPVKAVSGLEGELKASQTNIEKDTSLWLGNENNPLRLGQRLCDLERTMILQTLAHCGGNRTYAADILGISSRTLRNKLNQYSAEGCKVKPAPARQPEDITHAPH